MRTVALAFAILCCAWSAPARAHDAVALQNPSYTRTIIRTPPRPAPPPPAPEDPKPAS